MGCCASKKPATLTKQRSPTPFSGGSYSIGKGKTAPILKSSSSSSEKLSTLTSDVTFRVMSDAGGGFYQILPDQVDGEIAVGYLQLNAAEIERTALTQLPSSREIPGRYRLRASSPLHDRPSPKSEEIGEVLAGEELLLFDLSHHAQDGQCQVYARVKTQGNCIGWMVLEDAQGPKVDSTNLLGPDVAKIGNDAAQQTLKGAHSGIASGSVPWKVGGSYRTLHSQPLFEQPVLERHQKQTQTLLETVPSGSLVRLSQIKKLADDPEKSERKLWLMVRVVDGKKSGSSGWLRSVQGNQCLMDTRAQWEEEKLVVEELLAAYTAPISALRLPKVRKADGVQEIGNPLEDQPIQELDSQLDNHDREVACGLCMCRLLPVGRLHPAVLQEHDHSLPTAQADSQALTNEEFHRWLTNIYSRFNPRLLPKVPEYMQKYRGREPELVESICSKYRVAVPPGWYKLD